MRFAARSFRFALLCIAATFASTTFAVQTDLEANASSLTAGYGTQDSLLMRLSWNSAAQSLTQLALEHKRAFGERANIVVVNHAWDATALDRVSFALSASDAETIAARWRVDGQYSGKFGDQLNVVVSLGGFVSSTADGHRDHSVIPSFAWYFADRQVIEGGLRFARSDPGAQSAARGFVVYTWGAPGQDTLNVRVEGGRDFHVVFDTEARDARDHHRLHRRHTRHIFLDKLLHARIGKPHRVEHPALDRHHPPRHVPLARQGRDAFRHDSAHAVERADAREFIERAGGARGEHDGRGEAHAREVNFEVGVGRSGHARGVRASV